MIKHLLLLSLSLTTAYGCSDLKEQKAPPADQRLQPATGYPGYWSWDGETPVLLLGAGGAPEAFLDPDFEQKLNILADSGGNFSRIQYDLATAAPNLKDLLKYLTTAATNEIAVELTVSSSATTTGVVPPKKSFSHLIRQTHKFNNLLFVLSPALTKAGYLEILQNRRPGALVAGIDYQNGPSGVNQQRGFQHWKQLKEVALQRAGGSPLHFPAVSSFGEVAAEGIAAFNRSILAGAAAVRHRARPQGDGFSGAALANIRSVRTVEQHFDFWDLQPSPELTPTAGPNEAYAFTDGFDGYLIYLPTTGSVTLQLNLAEQVPLRVSVVGYLGSQKSELLQPPYKNRFTLYTDEPRGGWMLIKPLR